MRMAFVITLVVLAGLAAAALDQTYTQEVRRDGSSSMVKTADISMFTAQMDPALLARMKDTCTAGMAAACSVDAGGKTMTIGESLPQGEYYAFTSEYGFPFITYTMTVSSLPTDKFSKDMDLVLESSGWNNSGSGIGAKPLDFTDFEGNKENAAILKQLKAKLMYEIKMPAPVSEAGAGGDAAAAVNGQSATFDIVEVMQGGAPITVKSRELNLGLITLVAMAVVLAALAASFIMSRPKPKKEAKEKGKEPGKKAK